MYARGATPLRPLTAGWQPPVGLAAEPRAPGWDVGPGPARDDAATNVPWNDSSRSSGALLAPGPANPRATITFGDVPPRRPFGNPGG